MEVNIFEKRPIIQIVKDAHKQEPGCLYDAAVAESCMKLFKEKGYQLKLLRNTRPSCPTLTDLPYMFNLQK